MYRSTGNLNYDSLPAGKPRPTKPADKLHAAATDLLELLEVQSKDPLSSKQADSAQTARSRVQAELRTLHGQFDADRKKLDDLDAKAALERLDGIEKKTASIESELRTALDALPADGARAPAAAARATKLLAQLSPEEPHQPLLRARLQARQRPAACAGAQRRHHPGLQRAGRQRDHLRPPGESGARGPRRDARGEGHPGDPRARGAARRGPGEDLRVRPQQHRLHALLRHPQGGRPDAGRAVRLGRRPGRAADRAAARLGHTRSLRPGRCRVARRAGCELARRGRGARRAGGGRTGHPRLGRRPDDADPRQRRAREGALRARLGRGPRSECRLSRGRRGGRWQELAAARPVDQAHEGSLRLAATPASD